MERECLSWSAHDSSGPGMSRSRRWVERKGFVRIRGAHNAACSDLITVVRSRCDCLAPAVSALGLLSRSVAAEPGQTGVKIMFARGGTPATPRLRRRWKTKVIPRGRAVTQHVRVESGSAANWLHVFCQPPVALGRSRPWRSRQSLPIASQDWVSESRRGTTRAAPPCRRHQGILTAWLGLGS